MTGAGLANVVANVGLLNFALHFEKVLDKMNIRRPVLSAEQLHNPEVGYVQRAAKALGMLLGSLIGLMPLCFYDHPVDTRAKWEKKRRQFILDCFRKTWPQYFRLRAVFCFPKSRISWAC